MVTTVGSNSSIGIGSGLPLAELLKNLRTAEEIPLTLLARRKSDFDTKVSAYGALKNSISALQDAARKLVDPKAFEAVKTVSSKPEVVTAKGTAGVTTGSYAIEVEKLAKAQALAVQGIASRTENIGTGGTIKIQLEGEAGAREIELTEGSSLNAIVAAINKGNSGLSATVLNNGDASNPYQLILKAKDTGVAASVQSISVDGNVDLDGLIGYNGTPGGSVTQTIEAQDAKLTINGIAVTSSKNTLSGVIDGVDISILAETNGSPVNLDISSDTAATEAVIRGFMNAYNSLQTTLTNLTKFDVAAETQSSLTADTVARVVQNGIRDIVNTTVPDSALKALSSIGIRTDEKGMLAISTTSSFGRPPDSVTFNAALQKPDELAELFSGKEGYAQKVVNMAQDYLRTEGLIYNADAGVKRSIRDINRQYLSMQTRIEDKMAMYQKQFTELDKIVSQMSGIGAYLTQQMTVLNGTRNQKN